MPEEPTPQLPPQLDEPAGAEPPGEDRTLDAKPYEPPKRRVSWLAIAALIVGLGALAAWFFSSAHVMIWTRSWKWFLLAPLALGFAAFILGGAARRRIEDSDGLLFGTGARIAGQLMGVVALIVTVTCAGLPEPKMVRTSAKRAACKNNLRQIGIALHLYADENRGVFPAEPEVLYPSFTDNPAIFLCPTRSGKWQKSPDAGKLIVENPGYVYVAGLRADDPGPCVVAFDRQGNHKGSGRLVLCVDTTVEWTKVPSPGESDRLQEMLDQTREFVKKRGGEIRLVGEE
jgi:hypothetical protein